MRTFYINPLSHELNPICYLLALLAHDILHVSRIRVKSLTLRLLMSYIYIYIYDISNLRVKAMHPSVSNCTWPHIIEFCMMFVLSSARVRSLGL
jgi:hypothetical protein